MTHPTIEKMARAAVDAVRGACVCDHPQCECSYDCERDDRALEYHMVEMRKAMEAGLGALASTPPTPEMINAGYATCETATGPSEIYTAMLNQLVKEATKEGDRV